MEASQADATAGMGIASPPTGREFAPRALRSDCELSTVALRTQEGGVVMSGVLQGVTSGGHHRQRETFKFLLDVNKELDAFLASRLDELRAARRLTGFIRDACRLLFSLQAGRTDVLYSMFPHLRPEPREELLDVIQAGFSTLATALEHMPSAAPPPATPPANSPKPMPIQNAAIDTSPTEINVESFDLEIKQATPDEENRSDWNFLIASTLQVYGNCSSLPDEVIAYGQRTGRIPVSTDKIA